MRKLILIVGLPGSGKTTVAEFIKKHFNAYILHSGDVIREEIKRRGLKYTPESDMLIAHWFHTHGREKLIAKRVWEKVKKTKKNIVVIEGFRSLKTVNHFKRISKITPIIIAVEASFKVRAERELKRKRFGKKESIEYLKAREKLERKHGIIKLIKKADFKINNSRMTKKQTEKKVVEILKKVLESK